MDDSKAARFIWLDSNIKGNHENFSLTVEQFFNANRVGLDRTPKPWLSSALKLKAFSPTRLPIKSNIRTQQSQTVEIRTIEIKSLNLNPGVKLRQTVSDEESTYPWIPLTFLAALWFTPFLHFIARVIFSLTIGPLVI